MRHRHAEWPPASGRVSAGPVHSMRTALDVEYSGAASRSVPGTIAPEQPLGWSALIINGDPHAHGGGLLGLTRLGNARGYVVVDVSVARAIRCRMPANRRALPSLQQALDPRAVPKPIPMASMAVTRRRSRCERGETGRIIPAVAVGVAPEPYARQCGLIS